MARENNNGEIKLTNETIVTNDGFIKLNDVVLPESFKNFYTVIEEFKVRDDDVWVCSLPKAGTTWTQEMVWCIDNDLDFQRAKVLLTNRFPFFELSNLFGLIGITRRNTETNIPEYMKDSFDFIEKFPSPRYIKTHLPFCLLPREIRTGYKRPKIIYVFRNPKDTCISYFHFRTLVYGFQGEFEDFCNLYLRDTMTYQPFWKHVLGYWNKRYNENFLFLKYDEMIKDLPSTIKRTAKFLGKQLTTVQQSTLTKHLSYSEMRENQSANNENHVKDMQKVTRVTQNGSFMRNGNTEQWKTVMTPEMIKRFDDWTSENLKDTGLSI